MMMMIDERLHDKGGHIGALRREADNSSCGLSRMARGHKLMSPQLRFGRLLTRVTTHMGGTWTCCSEGTSRIERP